MKKWEQELVKNSTAGKYVAETLTEHPEAGNFEFVLTNTAKKACEMAEEELLGWIARSGFKPEPGGGMWFRRGGDAPISHEELLNLYKNR